MATEMVYTQAQYDGCGRALTTTLIELSERTDEVGRLAEAVRGIRETDALLRAQVAGLTKERDTYATERDAALTLVRALALAIGAIDGALCSSSLGLEWYAVRVTAMDALLNSAAVVLEEQDASRAALGDGAK